MNRQAILIAITIAVILAAVLGIVSWNREDARDAGPHPIGEAPTSDEDLEAEDLEAADLYFPSAGGWLRAERRDLPASEAVAERIATLVEALLAGPGGPDTTTPGIDASGLYAPGLYAPLPGGITVHRVYLADAGTVFLDLQSPEGAPPPPAGSRRELLTVYSLVNTVLLNVEGVERLVLLWNGRQPRTFAGHLDTMRPLVANTDLIARTP